MWCGMPRTDTMRLRVHARTECAPLGCRPHAAAASAMALTVVHRCGGGIRGGAGVVPVWWCAHITAAAPCGVCGALRADDGLWVATCGGMGG